MRKYNITKNLNAYGGRNEWSVGIGTTRNIRGSSNRIYQFCSRNSETPLYCMFQFLSPKKTIVEGFLNYSFDYIGILPLTKNLVLNYLPIITLTDIFFDINTNITIIGNNVNVKIDTLLSKSSSYPNNFGISFNKDDLVNFYNNNTINLILISTNNCPFSQTGSQFSNLNGINISPTFKPYFLPETSLSKCFNNCLNFNSDISNWDTSNVTNMSSMFESSIGNQNIFLANKFNNGETSLVNLTGNMSSATYTANSRLLTCGGANFLSELSTNDILFLEVSGNIVYYGSVRNITSATNLILYNLSLFVNITSGNILSIKKSINGTKPLNWNTINVTDMSNMFKSCVYFNQSIGSWNTSRVTNMNGMFYQDIIFNNGEFKGESGNPLLWNTLNVTSMIDIFRLDRAFNQNISTSGDYWNTSNVTDMGGMFREAYLFNQNITNWNTSKNTSMNSMFFQAQTFNNGGPLGSSTSPLNWNTSNVTVMESTFRQQNAFNQDISSFDTSNVKIMTLMFQSNAVFNQNIGNWDVSKVTAMNSMFQSATMFNNGNSNTIQNWDAPRCTTFASMFQGASVFNQPLTYLVDTSGVNTCTLASMFQGATQFNQNIGSWITSNVTIMTLMFQSNTVFNQNIGNWDVSKVTAMNSMFQLATMFNNGNSNTIQNWSAPLCTTFSSMFQGASVFNQPLTNLVNTSGLGTGSCSLASMFQGATQFNQNIGSWNTSNVTTMASMFAGTTSLATTTRFNNGETGLQSISNITPSSSSYTNNTKVLNCPGATFNSTLDSGDVLIIQTSTIIYSSSIASISDNQNLVLTTPFGANLVAGTITSINKQVAGGAPLNWNTSRVTTLLSMFQYCVFFNQNITKNVSIWNTNSVLTLATLFNGSTTSIITLFNNGQIITGTTAPMGWTFNVTPTSTNYRTNCRLTTANKPGPLG